LNAKPLPSVATSCLSRWSGGSDRGRIHTRDIPELTVILDVGGVRSCATLVRTSEPKKRLLWRKCGDESPANGRISRPCLTPSLPAIQHRQQEIAICRPFRALFRTRTGDPLLTMEVWTRYWRARPCTHGHVFPANRNFQVCRACPRVPARAQSDVPVSYPRRVVSLINRQLSQVRSACPGRSGDDSWNHRVAARVEQRPRARPHRRAATR
jgi:hypothetical protein